MSVTPFPWMRQRIRLRPASGDTWTVIPDLWCSGVTEAVGPRITQATLDFVAGKVVQPGQQAFDTVAPKDLAGKYISLEVLDDAEAVIENWIMQVVADNRMLGGIPAEGQPQPIRQQITAVGLEDLLDRRVITGGFVHLPEDPEPTDPPNPGRRVYTPMVFNERYRRGLNKTGNRSTVRLKGQFTTHTAYCFDTQTRAGVEPARWSVADILEYLLRNFVQTPFVYLPWTSIPEETPDALRDALRGIYPARFDVEGMTVKQAIDKLLTPELGLVWNFTYIAPDTMSLSAWLKIRTVSESGIVLDGVTLPANTSTASFNATDDPRILDCVVGDDRSMHYGVIEVVGEPVLSCFTIYKGHGTITQGWTNEEEIEFLSLRAFGAEEQADSDQYRNVFQRFMLPLDWDGNASGTLVNPVLNDAGVVTATAAPLVRRGHAFEELLPIPREQQDEATPEIEYQEWFVLLRRLEGATYRWEWAEKMTLHDMPPGRSSLANNELAFFLTFDDPTEASGLPAREYDWQVDMLATVALRTDQRLIYRKTMAGGDANRVLRIDVPDAELWLVQAQTVIGVNDDGSFKYYAGTGTERNDVGRLKDIAETVAAWHGRPQRAIELTTVSGEYYYHTLGDLMQLTVDAVPTVVKSVITARRFDFRANTITFATETRPLVPVL